MAAFRHSADASANIPDYEYQNVNSKPFHIGSFREEWLKRLKPSDYSFELEDEDTFDARFAQELGVNDDTMMELKSICNVESLRCHADDEKSDPDVVPSDSMLQTLVQRRERQELNASKKISKNRHDLYADELERLNIGKNPESEDDMIPEGEIILTINVFYPDVVEKFTYIRPHATLLMMGSHTLAELRDAICCASDLQVCGEFSDNPDAAPAFINRDHFKSAFFYFEGVFYNDMRFPECADISRTTMEWAESHNFPPFSQAKMEDTRFVDLKVKVGFPYLYCHQGDCEHLVIISDIRLAHRSDCMDKNLYPLLTYKYRFATQKCSVCHVFIGRWFTTGDRLAPSNPCLFCNKCFRMLHYDAEGKKLGEFQAFPFVDRGAFN